MIVLCDTSTAWCLLTLVSDEGEQFEYKWEAGRDLARHLLKYLRDCLAEHDWTFDDITGIGMMKGPGSFTGLRIGLTVFNTIASSSQVSIVSELKSENWRTKALERLHAGENEQIVLPYYDRPANITQPRK